MWIKKCVYGLKIIKNIKYDSKWSNKGEPGATSEQELQGIRSPGSAYSVPQFLNSTLLFSKSESDIY